jgi:RHS repeat-associated protein
VEKSRGSERHRYEYDAAGRLTRALTPDGEAVEFAYDALGRRVRKQTRTATVDFLWQGDLPVGERVRLPGGREEAHEYLFLPGTWEPAAIFGGDGASLLECDHLATPLAALARDGRVVWQAGYRAYGAVLREEGRAGAVPFRFPGQFADRETGLYYNRCRYYDPELHLYTSPDPIGLAGGAAAYNYATSPLAWMDPYGLAGCHTAEQKALLEMLERDTLGGRKALAAAEAEAAMDLAKEAGLGVRASAEDLAETANHWVGGPHVHIEGAGRGGHVKVLPGVVPRT